MIRALVIVSIAPLVACAGDKDDSKPDTEPRVADAGAASEPADAAPTPDAAATSPDAAAPSEPDAAPKDGDGDKASRAPQNIELLPRAWDVPRIKKHMKTYNRALGVKCDYCHEGKDFASDAKKPKTSARKMIRMTRSMNRRFFKKGNPLSCMTCHRGAAVPEAE